MRRVLSPALALILSIALCTVGLISSAFAAAPLKPVHAPAPSASNRITQAIDEAHVARMARNTRPEANSANDRGAVPDAFDVDHILLVMQRSAEQQQELDKFVVELNDRSSSNFHRWLTPEEFGDRFGVSQEDYDTVTSWLESHGFRINKLYPSRMMIDFGGNAGQIRGAFHTEMHNIAVNGQTHLSNMSDPLIPAALAPVVGGIASLNDFKPHATLKIKPDYTFGGCSSSAAVPTEPGTCYAITPADTETIYNLNPAFAAGYSGQGQTVALIEDTDTYGGTSPTGDVATYLNTFGISAAYPLGTYTVAHPGGCADPGTNADDSEANLDVEVAFSVAPSANIQLISCPSGTVTFGGLIALTNLVNAAGPYPGVASVSYGVCEALNGNGGNAAFANTYALAATEGISVFVSTGDDGPSSCSNEFGQNYDVSGEAVTGWGESIYNVAVGGTDFEDTYNSKTGQNGGAPLSTYWSATNSANYGSALSYIPEMPWDDACANTMISEVATNSFAPYGASPATCNNATFDVSTSYLSIGAASGGPSNCATGEEGTNASSSAIVAPQCQGYSKPSWQTGASLSGGLPVFGQNNDGVRDIPDVAMFAANGDWGHFETVCWSDPAYTADGSASCAGAPSTWSGFGGTSVATPTMAAVQALVNQKTGQMWGNPNPIYYQIGQNQYGTAGGSFQGAGCNSSTGNAGGCAFNDVTQGDIDLECEYDGAAQKAHCYLPAGTYGVTSTNNITAAAVLVGGSGYTTAPTCTIAGPSNNNPYIAPTGKILWAGGTQANCTATVNAGTNTAKWTVALTTAGDASGQQIIVGSQTYTIVSSTSTTTQASSLVTAINANNTVATATSNRGTVTITAKTAGAAGNFSVSYGSAEEFNNFGIAITNTVLGEGPNYVSGITITTAGSGYGPEAPITLAGGGGSGAVAVANTTLTTGAQSYQPAYGAAPGWDMASGLGSVNGYNLMTNCVWTSSCQTITVTTPPPGSATYNSSFGVAATASSGLAVAITTSGVCSGSGSGSATITMTGGTGTCSVIFNQAGNSSYAAAPTVTDTTSATPASQTITLTNVPASAAYGQSFTIGTSGGGSGNAVALTSDGVVCTNSGATYTMIASSGNCSVIANQTGNSNYSAAPQVTDYVAATTATSSTSVNSSSNPSVYGQLVTFTANIIGQYGAIKKAVKGPVKSQVIGGSVTWNDSNGPITCTESGSSTTIVTNGSATCTLSTLPVGTYTVTGTYSGDSSHGGSSGSLAQTINEAGAEVSVQGSPNPSAYGQTVVFTATINGQFGLLKGHKKQIASGSVAWSDANGSMNCSEGNPSTVNSSGAATCTVSNLAVNPSDTITAAYSGDSSHTAANGTASQEIDPASAGVSVGSSVSPSSMGQSVTFTATISGEYGLLKKKNAGKAKSQDVTGTVTWSGNTGCAPSTVTGGTGGNPGTATCITSILPAGPNTVTANYSGDSDHSGGSGSFNQSVNVGATSTNVTSVSPSTEDYGSSASVLITAVVSWTGNGPTPSASAIAISGNGPGSYSASACGAPTGNTITCTASYTPTAADPIGSYTETADFAGDLNYTYSNSPQTNNFTINLATSTTGVMSHPNPSTYAQQVTFTATITGENGAVKGRISRNGVKRQTVGGSVTWSTNTGCSTTPVTNGTATCVTSSATRLPVGNDTVTATYSGDSNHSGSNGSVIQVVQGGIATTINVTGVSPSSEDYGADMPVTITAVLSWTGPGAEPTKSDVTISGTGSGTYGATSCGAKSGDSYTCTATYTPTTGDGAGNYTETAAFSGDANYSASSSPQTNNFIINAASSSSSVSLTSGANPSTFGNSVTFTATVTGENGAVKKGVNRNGVKSNDITGTVTWSLNTGCAVSNVSGYPGVATCTTSALNTGKNTVTATYSGDGNHTGSSGSIAQTVNRASQSITVSFVPTTATERSTFTVSASASSGLPITYTASGNCSNDEATYTMGGKTTACLVIMNQFGNGNYSQAMQVINSVSVAAAQTPTVSVSGPTTAVYGTTFTVTPNSGGDFSVPTLKVAGGDCTISGTTVSMTLGTGTCTTTATWAANYVYAAATATLTTKAEKATSEVSWTTPAPITYGTALSGTQLDATVTNTTGTFKYTPAAGKVLAAGTQTLSVAFTPSTPADYTTVTQTVQIVVNQAGTTTTINSVSSSNPVKGAKVTVDYTVGNGSTSYPRGKVTVTDGEGDSCSADLSSGAGSCMITLKTAGQITLTATYAGDANDTASSGTYGITVQQ